MMRSMTKKVVLPAAAALMLGALLVGCSGTDGQSEKHPIASATPSVVKVDDTALAKAMDKLMYHGTGQKSPDGGSCFVQTIRNSGLSDAGLAHIVKADSDDLGALTDSMWKGFSADAAILAAPELRGSLDGCRSQKPGGDATKQPEKTYESPEPAQNPDAGKRPNLTPKYQIRPDAKITSSSQLTDGLVSMFSSFTTDEKQKKTYAAAGECLSNVVWEAKFSQESLRFLAGGAPIGTGSVVEHLPNKEDKAKWEDKAFTTALMDCTLNVDSTKVAGS